MNERIKELVTGALEVEHGHGAFGEYERSYRLNPEKLAELVIEQCGLYADVFDSLGCPTDMNSTDTQPSDYIKRQFGLTP